MLNTVGEQDCAIDRMGQVMTPPWIVSYINDSVIGKVEEDQEGAEERWKLVLAGLADGDGHARGEIYADWRRERGLGERPDLRPTTS